MSEITDKTSNEHLIESLEKIGLNEKQARVYIALLPYKDIGSSKLIRATGLHGQFVYDALARLEDLGLAKHVIQNGRKKFSANAPSRIISILDERRQSAQAIVRQLQEKFSGQHAQSFEVFQGDNAVSAHYFNLIKKTAPGSVIDVIAGPSERFFDMHGPEAEEFDRIRLSRKLSVRFISSETQRSYLDSKVAKKDWGWSYRIMPGLSLGLVNFEIYPDNVSINIWGNPVICFSIWNKEVADGYREFFNALWDLSTK